MRAFEDHNPIAVALYFLSVSGVAMFSANPFLLLLSLVGAVAFFFARNGCRGMRSHAAFLGLFVVCSLINPLVSHNGRTVLFVINDTPITAEAVIYGVVTATALIAVLYWFRSFTSIMTGDKLLYLFGKLSPKLALVLSMGIRYVPLFSRQAKKINAAQTALGLYKDDNIVDRARGGLRVFSVMVTWALEGGIVTADSMTARGYGTGRRSHFSVFRLRKTDALLMCVSLVLLALTVLSLSLGALDFEFYPSIAAAKLSPISWVGYISYGGLSALPTLIEVKEKIKWKYLRSKS